MRTVILRWQPKIVIFAPDDSQEESLRNTMTVLKPYKTNSVYLG